MSRPRAPQKPSLPGAGDGNRTRLARLEVWLLTLSNTRMWGQDYSCEHERAGPDAQWISDASNIPPRARMSPTSSPPDETRKCPRSRMVQREFLRGCFDEDITPDGRPLLTSFHADLRRGAGWPHPGSRRLPEPAGGIEPRPSPIPKECSALELHWQTGADDRN